MIRTLLGKSRRARLMREKWAMGQSSTDSYKARLAALVEPGMRVLHAGCGWDRNDVSRQFKDECTVIGVDVDPRVQSLFHSKFCLASLEELPFAADAFDVIFSEYVFEHLPDPERVLQELKRVVKTSGIVLILTPNYYSYKTLAASLTPHGFHEAMGRHRYGSGHEADMYPTLYRSNTEATFGALARRAGLKIVRFDLVTNGPTWFQKIPVVFEIFHVFHLVIKRWHMFRQLRCAIIVEMTK